MPEIDFNYRFRPTDSGSSTWFKTWSAWLHYAKQDDQGRYFLSREDAEQVLRVTPGFVLENRTTLQDVFNSMEFFDYAKVEGDRVILRTPEKIVAHPFPMRKSTRCLDMWFQISYCRA
jgi:hypothetical protein